MKITLEKLHALLKGIEVRLEKNAEAFDKKIQKVRFANSSNSLTINDAARYLGCSRSTIYNRINDGTLIPVMRANKHMIPVAQLENLYKPSL